MSNIDLSFLSAANPLWWVGLLLALATGLWAYYRIAAPLGSGVRTLLRVLRIGSLLILLFVLLEPMITHRGESAGRPHLSLLVDRSSSMHLPGSGEETRADEATLVLSHLTEALGDEFTLDVQGFAGNLSAHDGSSPYPWEPRGVTALGEALEEALMQQAETAVGGIILLTDGIHTSGKDPVLVARNMPIPIFSLLLGDTTAPRDLLLRQVRSQAIGYTGEPIGVRAIIENTRLAGQAVTLQIRRLERSGDSYRPEERVLAEKVMALPAETGRDLEVPLEFSPMRIGLSVYALTASVEMDEPVTRNNTRLFAVDVREKKTRILYIENEPDWDFTFLRRTLDADTSLSYTYLVRRPNGSYDNYNDVGAARLPRSSDELSPYAAVILGKVTSASLPLETVAVIRDYVIGGGGLLLLGGAKETGGGRSPAMWQDILPVRIIADRRSGYTSSLTTLSPSGMAHGITGVKQGDQIGTGGWENRPPIWIQEGQYSLAPGANMLISARTAHPAKEVPIFSLLHAGQGRVAMMSARGFWRWDFSTRSKSEQRSQAGEFWKRTMRWISEPSQKERFRINPAKYVFQDSEALSFSAVLQDASHNPVSDARIEVTLEPIVFIESDAAIEDRDSMAGERNQVPGGPGAAIHLQMYPAGSAGRYNATGAPQRPGMYRYEAVALVDGEAEPLRSGGQFWVEEMGPEFYHLASSPRLGEYLARVSDGMAARPDEMDRLAEEIPSLYKRVEVVRQAEIWNHWLLFGTLVLLLSIEWIIRRRRGLA